MPNSFIPSEESVRSWAHSIPLCLLAVFFREPNSQNSSLRTRQVLLWVGWFQPLWFQGSQTLRVNAEYLGLKVPCIGGLSGPQVQNHEVLGPLGKAMQVSQLKYRHRRAFALNGCIPILKLEKYTGVPCKYGGGGGGNGYPIRYEKVRCLCPIICRRHACDL